jgi:hypothetical protein
MRYLVAVLIGLSFLSITVLAKAGETISEDSVLVCVTDKWDEKEPEKGHKLADATQRCILVPREAGVGEKIAEDCVGKYEYMPDGSWTGSGTCTDKRKDGTLNVSWEEGSALNEYTYKITGGTGKYEGATGGGTYTYDNLTDTLVAGYDKGTINLP